MSNKRKKCRLLQNLYSIFLLNSKKRKKCRTKREKCQLFKISILHFFLNNKKRKKCQTIRHFCIRHFFIDFIVFYLHDLKIMLVLRNSCTDMYLLNTRVPSKSTKNPFNVFFEIKFDQTQR